MRPALTITDHALVRFLERAGGLNIEVLRLELAGSLSRARAVAEDLGGGDYVIVVDQLRYVVRSDTLVTILPLRGKE